MDTSQHKPGALQVLIKARALLLERGWVAWSDGGKLPFGPAEGPLTLAQALWCAARYDGKVDIAAVNTACKTICRALGLDVSQGFVALGKWCRAEGRTQEDVMAAFSAVKSYILRELAAFAGVSAGE